MNRTATTTLAACLGVVLLAGCGSGDNDGDGASTEGNGETGDTTPAPVTLLTHDSFDISEDVLERFTEETGHEVVIVRGGDAGVMVNQAVLTAGNPQADVLFGVDNTLLSRAVDEDVFEEYEAAGLDAVPEDLLPPDGGLSVTPIDTGDICVNWDRAWFAEEDLEPPVTLEDLADPALADLLVVQNPATSSPGLGFLLGTVAAFGEDGWQDYWQSLVDNGVEVVNGWEQAYYDHFSGSGGGDRPLVVSYATSPPAEVVFGSDPDPEEAPTGVSTGTCFRQVEFAGLLAGAENPDGGRALIDFMLSVPFQEDLPLTMFVNPARADVELPEVFTEYGVVVEDPYTLDPEVIAENRGSLVDDWTALVLR
ncbi:thiamine ABC transporter substrate binding subunit [Streptomyces sp. ST2-7A]|uniref:thiamine ABC transporter substrate-binding protein n=1 Tax=Streptomyces sp. ST2-7A TaxID=2907214 RepID=UPI001F410827|nr:thiamine ABC transporter substrate-binding protein [Streptomyces sp. ST2-7A]MCE7079984.1 thiamine ABC transporter substrate-binding protein [Streptomyces sp. ST2-7A]